MRRLLLAASVLAGLLLGARAGASTPPSPLPPQGVAACLECHGNPALTMVRDGVARPAHVDGAVYSASAHGVLSCARCHAEADTRAHAERPKDPLGLPTGRDLAIAMSGRCVKCHTGLPATSYRRSFHGIAITHGDTRAATCVDCHGTHAIFPAQDARATTAEANLAATCGTAACHPGAPAGFAVGQEHFDVEVPGASDPILHWVWKFFIGLILFDVMKDGPIVMFELLRRVRG